MSQHSIELYCLRLQLHHVLGATGYEDLTTVDEEVCPNFLAAAVSSGLLEADAELSKRKEGRGWRKLHSSNLMMT